MEVIVMLLEGGNGSYSSVVEKDLQLSGCVGVEEIYQLLRRGAIICAIKIGDANMVPIFTYWANIHF